MVPWLTAGLRSSWTCSGGPTLTLACLTRPRLKRIAVSCAPGASGLRPACAKDRPFRLASGRPRRYAEGGYRVRPRGGPHAEAVLGSVGGHPDRRWVPAAAALPRAV